MEPEQLREITKENSSLEAKSAKEDQQYILNLKKSLEAADLSGEEKVKTLYDILSTLVAEQEDGKTARQLFGTVSERTEATINKPAEVQNTSTPLSMWLDNTLLLLDLSDIMTVITGLFSRGTTPTYRSSILVPGSAIGGWIFCMMHKYIYQYEYPGTDRSRKPGMGKVLLVLGGTTLL